MYRPTKRKLVRRVSVASVVAVMSAAGLGIAFVAQSGATTSALAGSKSTTTSAATTSASTKSATKSVTPHYRIVVTHHDDHGSTDDN